jgi:tRNA A37 threonylcarbamoyladenosine synthetase subunit TsaC/SUA5/YrdC
MGELRKYMIFLLPTDTCYGLAGEFTEADYLEIYRLKGRDFSKPLAFLVESFDDMKQYIEITDEQIEFLRNYPHPWSFLWKRICELPEWIESERYSMISLRVGDICIPKQQENISYPLFLTSANLSGNPESKTLAEARVFFPWVEWIDGWICDRPPSDIFSIWDDEELKYLRRNY